MIEAFYSLVRAAHIAEDDAAKQVRQSLVVLVFAQALTRYVLPSFGGRGLSEHLPSPCRIKKGPASCSRS